MVLRIEIRPEESCESLEKLLLKIHGVHEVGINREKQKVTILGDVNPLKLVKYIAKMGKRAELLVYDKKPKIDAPNPHHKTNKKHGNTRQYAHVHHHPHCNATNDYNYEPSSSSSSSAKDADRREQHSAHNNDKYRGKKTVEEEDQEFFHSVPPPDDHQYFHGAKFEEEIKEAKRDMNRFFTGAAGTGSSAYHHHHHMPRPNYSHWTRDHQHYGDRNHPHPPRRVYSATRPGTHYDKFTNFFSDENPSSCTII